MNENKAKLSGLLSEKDAAARLGIGQTTLVRVRGAGEVKFYRIGRRVFYSAFQLDEFLASRERKERGPKRASGNAKPRSAWGYLRLVVCAKALLHSLELFSCWLQSPWLLAVTRTLMNILSFAERMRGAFDTSDAISREL